VQETTARDGLRGVLHHPEHPNGSALALTHGAGADCHAPLLAQLARVSAEAGLLVLRYDLPFRQRRAKGPPAPAAAARDREGVVRAVEMLRSRVPGRAIAGGHSYGGRQTAMAAAGNPQMADALLLLSYPLHPPNHPEKPRTAFFSDWRTPALFVHGSSDPFGTLEEMGAALKRIPARVELMAAEGAGHDLNCAGLAVRVVERLRRLVLF
jgi:predicted alpha/beta-hydrolase family hydrolase